MPCQALSRHVSRVVPCIKQLFVMKTAYIQQLLVFAVSTLDLDTGLLFLWLTGLGAAAFFSFHFPDLGEESVSPLRCVDTGSEVSEPSW